MSSSDSNVSQDLIDQFCAITGSTGSVGKRLLEACNGNLELAIGMHMDSDGVEQMEDVETSQIPCASELSASAATPDEFCEIRAPIPQKREVLVDSEPTFGFRGRKSRKARSVFDGFRDFQAEARQQEEQLCVGTSTSTSTRSTSSRKRTLEDLFRPPIDLTFKGSFSSARDTGTNQNKWLLVNIQNVQEFVCQALNRDIWSNAAVKSIVKAHFIFWQVYHDGEEGKKFTQFYKVKDWPFIAILDPRTGENMVTWSNVDSTTFCDLITDFLTMHPSPDGTSSSPPSKKLKQEPTILDSQEDDQLQAAIKASLSETVARSKKSYFLPDSDSECTDDLESFTDSDEGELHTNKDHSSPEKKGKNQLTPKKSTKNVPQASSIIPPPRKTVTNELSGLSVSERCDTQCASNTDIPDGSNINNNQLSNEKESPSWKTYCGDENDPQTTIALRFPDGNRQQLSLPCSSTLKALEVYVFEQGYSNENYELVTCFPRKQLSNMESTKTLESAGLHPQDTVFVQAR